MKTCRFARLFLSASIALGSFSANVNGATSGAVGAVSFDIPIGPTIVSFPFLKSVVQQGAVSSVSGDTFDIPSDATGLDDGLHYVHVLDGTAAGYVLDVVSVSGNTITVSDIGLADAASLGLTDGDIVAVRPHFTVSDITEMPPAGISITLLGAGGNPVVVSKTLFGTTWTDPDTVIYPGEAVIFNNPTVYTATIYGAVSEDDVIFSALGGPQAVGAIDPINGAADVISSIKASSPSNVTLTELGAGGAPTVYAKDFIFGNWQLDPDLIDTTNFKSVIYNAAATDIVHAGVVIAP